jgi:hypothetical protein
MNGIEVTPDMIKWYDFVKEAMKYFINSTAYQGFTQILCHGFCWFVSTYFFSSNG